MKAIESTVTTTKKKHNTKIQTQQQVRRRSSIFCSSSFLEENDSSRFVMYGVFLFSSSSRIYYSVRGLFFLNYSMRAYIYVSFSLSSCVFSSRHRRARQEKRQSKKKTSNEKYARRSPLNTFTIHFVCTSTHRSTHTHEQTLTTYRYDRAHSELRTRAPKSTHHQHNASPAHCTC